MDAPILARLRSFDPPSHVLGSVWITISIRCRVSSVAVVLSNFLADHTVCSIRTVRRIRIEVRACTCKHVHVLCTDETPDHCNLRATS
ncbi:hypothetical protein T440DRAFT_187789 [Plenodomus tracheiphilus IPT5]|uniref:Uncharacterized protein n=1 Tax=Plenodomus tracheiphilus IPT5 TaxID=1408161 RepID=A0A6A7AWZ2_9PLEO|nr:hypothetical protein T440DRAFT_187789 [Plenodomus tracheiphilus IPT5]